LSAIFISYNMIEKLITFDNAYIRHDSHAHLTFKVQSSLFLTLLIFHVLH